MKTAHSVRKPSRTFRQSLRTHMQRWKSHPFSALIRFATILSMAVVIVMLLTLVLDILVKGIPNLRASMFSPEYTTDNQSLLPALINTFLITMLSLLIAVPLTIQTFLIFFIAYFASKALKLKHDIAAPAGMIGASHFFELAVAVAISLFGSQRPVALATIVGVLVEVPVMLALVKIANRTKGWFPA